MRKGCAWAANLLYDPFILRYKNDPRFTAFCRKVGLPVFGGSSRAEIGLTRRFGGRPLRAIWMSASWMRGRPLRVNLSQ